MHLIIIREAQKDEAAIEGNLLRYALTTAPLADVIHEGLRLLDHCPANGGLGERIGWTGPEDSLWVIPRRWGGNWPAGLGRVIHHGGLDDLDFGTSQGCRSPWTLISNGRFVTHFDCRLLTQFLRDTRADLLAVMASPDLLAYREVVRLTQDNEVVGYRRLHADSIAPIPPPAGWPHHLLVRSAALESALGGCLLSTFDTVIERCRARGLSLQGAAVAGSVLDSESEGGILALCELVLRRGTSHGRKPRGPANGPLGSEDGEISPQARLIGPVRVGKRVIVEPGAVVVGPSVLCDDSRIQRGAVVETSILGARTSVVPHSVLRNTLVMTPAPSRAPGRTPAVWTDVFPRARIRRRGDGVFRTWPPFSYARCFKRMADVATAVLVLALFAPIIPFIVVAIKINSRGPAFFRDRRQGLHGKPFDCIKFRTMKVGADRIQEKLRFVSEVNGPQFKMADDPRITTVGHFLRETYLDEIPQFFNVLCGQMSVVGPRPSPESENTLCPSWRDARLSVRPGITGLWQVCRTREPLKDFQEWIHYDTQYVRDLSPRLDLWIGWRTFRRMVENFIRQF